MKDRLVIDADGLILALECSPYDAQHYLDRQTGEIHFTSDYADTDEAQDRIEADPERYLRIDPVPSSVGWNVMRDFIEQLPAGDAQERLARAIQRNHPFRRFKDTLFDYPDVRDAWFRFHTRAYLGLAREWLEAEEVDAELTLREGAAQQD